MGLYKFRPSECKFFFPALQLGEWEISALLPGFASHTHRLVLEIGRTLAVNPSVDSIQEFKIQKSMYPAKFGGKPSALINVATKAGSNALRGSLFEFHRTMRSIP